MFGIGELAGRFGLATHVLRSKRLIEHALSCDHPDFTECPRFHRLISALSPRTG